MATQTITVHNYQTDETGKVTSFVGTTSYEIEVQTQEELIAEKEAQLLAMYEELKSLKGE